MTIAAIACLLTAVAMAGGARFIRHSKAAEATDSVRAIGMGAARYFNESDAREPTVTEPARQKAMRHFPTSSKESVPSDPIDVRGSRYQSNDADWAVTPWRELRFKLVQPQSYLYSFQAEGTGAEARATAIAEGDLNGDGRRSRFVVEITPNDEIDAPTVRQTPKITDADE